MSECEVVVYTASGDNVWRSRIVPADEAAQAALVLHAKHPRLVVGVFEIPGGGGEAWFFFPELDERN